MCSRVAAMRTLQKWCQEFYLYVHVATACKVETGEVSCLLEVIMRVM